MERTNERTKKRRFLDNYCLGAFSKFPSVIYYLAMKNKMTFSEAFPRVKRENIPGERHKMTQTCTHQAVWHFSRTIFGCCFGFNREAKKDGIKLIVDCTDRDISSFVRFFYILSKISHFGENIIDF